jgi:hypothetical protein
MSTSAGRALEQLYPKTLTGSAPDDMRILYAAVELIHGLAGHEDTPAQGCMDCIRKAGGMNMEMLLSDREATVKGQHWRQAR